MGVIKRRKSVIKFSPLGKAGGEILQCSSLLGNSGERICGTSCGAPCTRGCLEKNVKNIKKNVKNIKLLNCEFMEPHMRPGKQKLLKLKLNKLKIEIQQKCKMYTN